MIFPLSEPPLQLLRIRAAAERAANEAKGIVADDSEQSTEDNEEDEGEGEGEGEGKGEGEGEGEGKRESKKQQ